MDDKIEIYSLGSPVPEEMIKLIQEVVKTAKELDKEQNQPTVRQIIENTIEDLSKIPNIISGVTQILELFLKLEGKATPEDIIPLKDALETTGETLDFFSNCYLKGLKHLFEILILQVEAEDDATFSDILDS